LAFVMRQWGIDRLADGGQWAEQATGVYGMSCEIEARFGMIHREILNT